MPASGSEQVITIATYGLMPVRRPAGGATVANRRAEVGVLAPIDGIVNMGHDGDGGASEGEARVARARAAGYTTDDEV